MTSSARLLPRPSWAGGAVLFAAAAAAVLLSCGHAQAATGSADAGIGLPADVGNVLPANALAVTDMPARPPSPAAPVTRAAVHTVSRVVDVVRAPAQRGATAVVATAARLSDAAQPVASALRTPVATAVSPAAGLLGDSGTPDGDIPNTDTAQSVVSGPTAAPESDRAPSNPSAPAAAPITTIQHALAPVHLGTPNGAIERGTPQLPAPVAAFPQPYDPAAVPTAPAQGGSGGPGSGGQTSATAQAVTLLALSTAGLAAVVLASRLVRDVRTDGSSAFMVSIVEWPG